MARKKTFWDKFWRDERGRDVIWQRPNKLMLIWIFIALLNLFLRGGTFEDILSWIATIVLFLWASLELVWGVNYFWKLVGFCVLAIILFSRVI